MTPEERKDRRLILTCAAILAVCVGLLVYWGLHPAPIPIADRQTGGQMTIPKALYLHVEGLRRCLKSAQRDAAQLRTLAALSKPSDYIEPRDREILLLEALVELLPRIEASL
jgi:hypothetical protein